MSRTRVRFGSFAPILAIVAIVWIVEAVNLFFGHGFARFGIVPRTLDGLIGIVVSPFIHTSLYHAMANTVPLLILGGLVAVDGKRRFNNVTAFVVIVGGLGVWLFARTASHAGASGLVFGYFGFLLARGWFDRRFLYVLIAVGVLLFYGGMIWGVMPHFGRTSWEAHLFGALAGGAAAWLKVR